MKPKQVSKLKSAAAKKLDKWVTKVEKKNFKCNICHKTFKDRSSFMHHRKTHSSQFKKAAKDLQSTPHQFKSPEMSSDSPSSVTNKYQRPFVIENLSMYDPKISLSGDVIADALFMFNRKLYCVVGNIECFATCELTEMHAHRVQHHPFLEKRIPFAKWKESVREVNNSKNIYSEMRDIFDVNTPHTVNISCVSDEINSYKYRPNVKDFLEKQVLKRISNTNEYQSDSKKPEGQKIQEPIRDSFRQYLDSLQGERESFL